VKIVVVAAILSVLGVSHHSGEIQFDTWEHMLLPSEKHFEM
jgi:hypothetical protein